tara:strand:- start:1285 stop:2550 length:1266 start_codon:yes stop_codon:yes gene_type:complete
MKKNKNKINLFFEHNGVTKVVKKRKPFLNAIPLKIVSKVIIPPYAQHHAESYFGVGSGQFFNRFNALTSVPHNEKFYYPIIFSLSQLIDYVNELIIPNFILDAINHGTCKILIVCTYEGWPWTMYDSLIEPLAERYNIPLDAFVAMTGNLTKNPKYKTIYFSNWEVSPRWRNTTLDRKLGYDAIFNRTEPRKHKFICLNRRATVHRFAVIAKLFPHRDQGLLSFCQVGHSPNDRPPKLTYYWNNLDGFKENYPNIYKEWVDLKITEHLPLILPKDIDPYDVTQDDVNPTNDEYPDKFYNSYLHITTETTAIDTGFFSEKMFKPIIYFQPFVVVGQYRALEYFKELGYKTFSDVIDESYDLEPDLELRSEKATTAAINFMQRDDLDEIMKQLWPIFEHNFNLFVSRFDLLFDKLTQDLRENL